MSAKFQLKARSWNFLFRSNTARTWLSRINAALLHHYATHGHHNATRRWLSLRSPGTRLSRSRPCSRYATSFHAAVYRFRAACRRQFLRDVGALSAPNTVPNRCGAPAKNSIKSFAVASAFRASSSIVTTRNVRARRDRRPTRRSRHCSSACRRLSARCRGIA